MTKALYQIENNIFFPIKLLTTTIILTVICGVGLFVMFKKSHQSLELFIKREMEMVNMENKIIYHDEVLTASVMLAANKDQDYQLWRNRYNYHEMELDRLIAETEKMLIQLNYDVEPILKTRLANEKLLEMEKKAFDLIVKKDFATAKKILFSEQYSEYKKLYSSAILKMISNAKDLASGLLARNRTYIHYLEWAALIMMAVLVAIWIYVILSIGAWLRKTQYLFVKLEEKNKELERFNFFIAHDLKESLRSIYSFSQLTNDLLTDNKQAKDYLARIQNSCISIKRLINDLLSYARLESVENEYSEVNLENMIATICSESLQGLIAEHKAIIKYDNLPIINSEPIKLRQIFYNLIANGIIYNRSEVPIIQLSFLKGNNEWIVAVTDNGIGIGEEYHEKIFELFTRLNNKRFYNGTGLGLAICRKNANKIGGKIWVDKSDDQGTTFKISLPFKKRS